MKTQGHTGFATSGYQTGVLSGDLAHLQRLLGASSKQAEDQLAASCLRQPVRCPRCGEGGCRPRGGRRYGCSSCRAEFGLFDGRWLSRRRITPRAWVLTLKGFELGLGGQEISELTGLSMPTVYKTLETIRMALACLDPRWEALVGSLEKAQGQPWREVFGITESDGRVRVDSREGGEGFVYPGRHAGGRRPEGPFLRYLLSQTAKHCGIPPASFPLYLKEYELRFNSRGRPLFELLLEAVARPRRSGS